jgi:hypothetical protein
MSEQFWTPGDPVVIDLVRRPSAEVAWVLLLAGGFLLWMTFAPVRSGDPSIGQVAVVAASGLCLLIGLVQLARRMFRLQVRGLFLEPGGLALEQSGGRSWSVSWDELSGVSVSTVRKQGRAWLSIDLVPAESGSRFEARHAELAQFRARNGGAGTGDGTETTYRVPLAPGQKHFVALERGLVLYAQARYREPGP